MNWRQIIITVVVLIVVAGGFWWAFSPQPTGVDLETLRRDTLVVTVDDEGTAQIRDTYQISTPVAGEVDRIPFEVGDMIEQGAVVATITSQLSSLLDERTRAQAEAAVRAAEAAVTAAENDVASAKSALDFAHDEVTRTDALYEREVVTEQVAEAKRLELAQADLAYENAKSALEVRQRELEQAQAVLLEPSGEEEGSTRFQVKAPITGRVLEITNESARSLAAGTALMTIGDPRDLEIVVDLLSTDVVNIDIGAPARIDGWGRDTPLEAKVTRIEPIGFTKTSALGIEEQRVRVHLDILSPAQTWSSLGHLYRVFVRIETQRVEDAVLMPTAALFRENNTWAVFAYEDGVARLHHVTLGVRSSDYAVVTDGLDEGVQVIVHPSDAIDDGSLIVDRATLED